MKRADGWKFPSHLRFIRSLPCCVCGAEAEAAHVRRNDPTRGKFQAVGQKPHDRYTVPLCPAHHRLGPGSQHSMAESTFWQRAGINPEALADFLWERSGQSSDMQVMQARRLFPWGSPKRPR